MIQKLKENKHYNTLIIVITGICFYLTLLLFLKSQNLAPFGGRSLAVNDANYQYLDFFAYLKDVLNGDNNIDYSFSIGMGQTGFGICMYYLMSPFNILLLFFDKTNLDSFFDITVICKLTTCFFTMSFYLVKRFKGKLGTIYIILLSISYSLSHYCITQARNIMWLDGVYMLPIIMLGIYYLINKKNYILLPISVCMSILFSWYSAGINCVFSFFWFLFELSMYSISSTRRSIFDMIKQFFLYIVEMIIGLLMSSFMFFPNLLTLRNGKGASFEWSDLSNTFLGNPLELVYQYSIGTISTTPANPSIYVGGVVLIGMLAYIISEKNMKKKVLSIGMLSFIWLALYWRPLFFVFSLLKGAYSYWSRYAYIGSFALVFFAANYYSAVQKESLKLLPRIALLYSVVIFLLFYIKKDRDIKLLYISSFFVVAITGCLCLLYKNNNSNRVLNKLVICGFLMCSLFELFYNANILVDHYSRDDYQEDIEYRQKTEETIDLIKTYDSSIYRITQNSTRNMTKQNMTAYYDEAMFLNYMGVASYTSAPDNKYLRLLDNLGYRAEGAV